MNDRTKIDPEFKSLIPPLSLEEYEGLERNLKDEGCRDPIVTWDGIILDGHNRYEICRREDIPFRTISKSFEGRDQAKEWIIRNQLGRRNLSLLDRGRLALLLEPIIKAKAKEKQIESGGAVLQKSAKPPIDTREELAKIAGVSHDTIDKVKTIEKKATPEQKEQLKTKEKSINKVYREIKDKARQINGKAKKSGPVKKNIKLDLEAASDARVFATMAISQLERIREDDPNREKELERVGVWIKAHKKGDKENGR